jgi:hypothetical protein
MPELPTWEVSKEIADRLPGGKDGGKDEKCPECQQPLKGADERDKKGW